MDERDGYRTVEELSEDAGIPVRTIRYYISEGLLPPPQGRGRASAYSAEHMDRLLVIRRLVEQHVPLQEIRSRISSLSAVELESLLAEMLIRRTEEESARTQSPREYLSALLSRAKEERRQEWAVQTLQAPVSAIPPDLTLRGPEELPGPWRRYEFAKGVELHVSRAAERSERELLRRLFQATTQEEKES